MGSCKIPMLMDIRQAIQASNPLPYWWREIRASGRASFGQHIVQEGYNDPAAQHFALWQVVAFKLPVAQQEASGWWDSPPTLCGLCPQDFLPPTTTSNFWIMMQAKMLVLARLHRHVLRHLGLRQAFFARQTGNYSNVWPLWWPSRRMTW